MNAGDVVRLKSGGPTMTVDRVYAGVSGGQKAECQWFENNQLKVGQFSITSLESAEKAGPARA